MAEHVNESQENKSQVVTPGVQQSQSEGESIFQFVDNRPNSLVQMKLQQLANNSRQVKGINQLQTMAANYSTQQRPPIQRQENKTGLPDQLKSGMESISGLSLSDVKVHRNSDKPAQLQAHAYAQGTDIHLGPGQEKHLPHELGHVVQQKQGRVKPTVQLKGKVNVNDDAGLEKEADVLGAKALQGRFVVPGILQKVENNFSSKLPAQLVGGKESAQAGLEDSLGEKGSSGQVNPMHATLLTDELQEGRSTNELKRYVAFLKLFLDDVMKIEFTNAKSTKENNDYLKKLEILHTSLNAAGVACGITSVFVLTAVSGGMAPLAAAAAGVATHWAMGASLSGAGLAVGVAKDRAGDSSSKKETTKSAAAQEVGINSLGNGLLGTEQGGMATGKSIGGKLGEGLIKDAPNIGGFLAGQYGGILGVLGLKNNRETFLKLAEGKRASIAEFNSIGVTLMQVKSQLLKLREDISVAELINPILPDIDKTNAKIQNITGTFPVLPTVKDVEL